jgi:hypothetical protein
MKKYFKFHFFWRWRKHLYYFEYLDSLSALRSKCEKPVTKYDTTTHLRLPTLLRAHCQKPGTTVPLELSV